MKINGKRETQSQILPHQESWSTKQPREFGWEGCQEGCQSNSGKNPSPLAGTTSLSPPGERDAFPRIDSNLLQSKVRHLCPTSLPFPDKEIRTPMQSN